MNSNLLGREIGAALFNFIKVCTIYGSAPDSNLVSDL